MYRKFYEKYNNYPPIGMVYDYWIKNKEKVTEDRIKEEVERLKRIA